MKVTGDYHDAGYALLEGLIPAEVADGFMYALKQDVGPQPIALSRVDQYPNLLNRPAFEAYGFHYKPMLFFLWGLTPIVSEIVGRDLLPTYDYLRVYRGGDVCKVHCDRLSCEHSLSLTLAYSDGHAWPLEIGHQNQAPSSRVEEGWDEAHSAVPMQVGDAVLYQGVHHRHGRTMPNPNRWSAHLFLHWVDREGPYRDQAFDGKGDPPKVDFSFA
ncbi:MAG: hypothetical protein JO276_13410 [Sphingomonadaceae bacterium]|nr:hypothetical protein [Sphingomonadaceae bacterium]